jgi:hypothetical protein
MKIDVCDKCGRSFLRNIAVVATYDFIRIKDNKQITTYASIDLCENCLENIIRDIKEKYPQDGSKKYCTCGRMFKE